MAKPKSKNDIKITSIKRSNVVIKKGAKTAVVSRKPRAPKKKLEIEDEVKKEVAQETEIVKKPVEKKNTTPKVNKPQENKTGPVKKANTVKLTTEELAALRKERNRKKYQNQQKKYQENKKQKPKKEVVVEDKIDDKINDKLKNSKTVNEEDLVKKVKEKEKETKVEEKKKVRKEKRKTNRKAIHLTQTLTTIKEKSVTKINDVKDRANDKHIPVGKTRNDKKRRSKRLIKEAILYSIILTIINISCIVIFDYFNFLRLFDIKALNIVTTIVISLIFNFFVAFMVDYFVTFVWLKKKRKKKVGEQDGNNGVNKEEHREDIQDKEGK